MLTLPRAVMSDGRWAACYVVNTFMLEHCLTDWLQYHPSESTVTMLIYRALDRHHCLQPCVSMYDYNRLSYSHEHMQLIKFAQQRGQDLDQRIAEAIGLPTVPTAIRSIRFRFRLSLHQHLLEVYLEESP